MEMTSLRVVNYKGLRDLTIPLSRFGCLIGENNAGKSSVLLALTYFFSGASLPRADFFDETSEIRIEINFTGVGEADIGRLADEHREKVKGIVDSGALTLARVYGTDGKGRLKYRKLVPRGARFNSDALDALVKGKKAGPLLKAVVEAFPELDGKVTAAMTQGEMRGQIQALADSLPAEEKHLSDLDLPTGIDKSIDAMLPEPIYIRAVKDLKDDVKTGDNAAFGKILGILLKAIEPKLADVKALFADLNKTLNRVILPDGSIQDDRLAEVRQIEAVVQQYVRESFANVSVKIAVPPPELKTVFSGAQIYANDGVDGLIESKGDGLRRAMVFAILRSYVELSRSGALAGAEGDPPDEARYLLLFEEPELYLHPKAQQVLFETLSVFSGKHPVMVTTHSPTFFGPSGTTTFVKLSKKRDLALSDKPFSVAHAVELAGDAAKDARDQFQIICYENNNIAFFAEKVVLVEGDSDYIAFPHLAATIDPAWNCELRPVRFARIGGKGNIRRYTEFFKRFNMRVFVITDLDFILGSEFGQIDPSPDIVDARGKLLQAADAIIGGIAPEPSAKHIEKAHGKGELRGLWRRVRELQAAYKEGKSDLDAVDKAVDEFFAWEKYWARRDILGESLNAGLLAMKRALLARLRSCGVCVLEKGALDDYYPDSIAGDGKPAKAQCFCNTIMTREQALGLCADGHKGHDGVDCREFQAIFGTIFSD